MCDTRVLLVDDEEDFVRTLAKRLNSRGYAVTVAPNGLSALELINKETFDVIVIDIKMPGIDGFETLKLMLEHNRDLQIIFLTGHASIPIGIEAMENGAIDFMEKPAEINKVIEAINAAKAKKQLLDNKDYGQSQ